VDLYFTIKTVINQLRMENIMALIVKPVVLPSTLVGVSNGKLPDSLLVRVDTWSRALLHANAARAWNALKAECIANGLPITFTYGGMYRPYQDQYNLFLARHTQVSYATYLITSSSKRKMWVRDGVKTYWKLNAGMAMAAVPGTSNHGLGLAIDTAYDKDLADGIGPDDAVGISSHPKFPLFRDVLVPKYGFSFEAQSEPWHIRYVTGDIIPAAVLAFERGNTPVTPPNPGVKYVQATVKLGSVSADVYALQAVLKLKAGQTLTINGTFDEATNVGLKNFQSFFGLTADGVCGPKTWAVVNTTANL